MKGMVLAAGRGERMRPLTDTTPKPLLEAGGRSLVEHLVAGLARGGITRLVVNHSHLGEQIEDRLGDGSRLGVHIDYSREGETRLETGGGIFRALPLLGDEPFAIVNADIWTDFPFASLPAAPPGLAHLVLVPNPAHHPAGDFTLAHGRVGNAADDRCTYSGIAVLRPALFAGCSAGVFPLAPLLRAAADRGEVSGELWSGTWMDIGTPEALRLLDERLGQRLGPRSG